MAAGFGVHRLTIAKAIRVLIKRGILQSAPGKGIFVAAVPEVPKPMQPPTTPFFDGIAEGPVADNADIDERLGGFVRRSLSHRQISFAAGFPPEEMIPTESLRRIAGQVARQSDSQPFAYTNPEGDPFLVEQIRAYLEERGMRIKIDDRILVTSGCQEALSLCLECFFSHVKGLALESPGYLGIIAGCRLRQIPMFGVPVDQGGIHPGRLEPYLESKEAVGFYTVPNFQNPTGVTQQLRRRARLLALSTRYDAIIIEDDIYTDIRFGGRPIPSLKSLDRGDRVIYVGSFSKSLAPGLRIGFIVATGEIALRLRHYKEAWDISSNTLSQKVVATFLSSGAYQRHLHRVRRTYKNRRNTMLSTLEYHLSKYAVITRPKGGMHVWVMLNRGIDMTRVEELAGQAGILFAPGQLFFPDERKSSTFRLNFATNEPAIIEEGVKRLSQIIIEEMES